MMNADVNTSSSYGKVLSIGAVPAFVYRAELSSQCPATEPLLTMTWINGKDQSTKTPEILSLFQAIANYKQARGPQRHTLRADVVRQIISSQAANQLARGRSPTEYMSQALSSLVAGTSPGRLDDAIDVFSQLGTSTERYAAHTLTTTTSDTVSDDQLYVLVRSMARASSRDAVLRMLEACSNMPNRTVREAVVEALGEFGDAKSIELLRHIASNDDSAFVRGLAEDTLDELSQ